VVSLQDPFATEMEWTAMPTPSEGKPRRRDASEILSRMARRLGRRRPSQLRIRIGTHVIATHVLPGTVELVRVPAVVTNVERDSDGIVYRLDIDEGAAAWRGPQLRLVDPSPDALLPF
jgi:hypothetical protein